MRTAAIALAVVIGFAAPARADKADQLFRKGKKLLAEKKYAEACTAFEQSDKLDSQIGAKLNVARCYEEWGKVATAWRWYSEAEQMAGKAHDDRLAKIRERMADLDRDVPRLTLRLPADAVLDGVVIRLDGTELAATELGEARRVDPGPHRVEAIVAGVSHGRTVPVEHGGAEVVLDVPVRRGGKRPAPSPTVSGTPQPTEPTDSADAGRTRRLLGLGVTGAGALALGIAGIVTLNAHSDYQHALDGYCGSRIDMCDDTGLARTHSARHRANIATGITIAGIAAMAGGAFLYFTAPRAESREPHALYLAPALGGATGVVLGGAF